MKFQVVLLLSILSSQLFAQNPCQQGTILINNVAVDAVEYDNYTGLRLPLWLKAGTTLAAGSRVHFVSVIEFDVNEQAGSNNLTFNQVLHIGSQSATVPPGKTWKIESIVKFANVFASGFIASSNSPVCQSQPLNLSVASVPDATYQWTGPNGFASASQSPVIASALPASAGTYSVTATLNGCVSPPSSVNVVVNSLPSSSFTTSPALATTNSNVTFNPAVSGATYAWTFESGTPASGNIQNPVVQWSSQGNYNVTLTVTDANGCSSTSTQVVTVSSCLPDQPSSAFTWSPLANSPATFSPAVSGIAYNWTFENGTPATSDVQNPVVTWSTGGSFEVSLTTISGGCSTTTTQMVTVLPQGCIRASDNTVWCIGWENNQSGNDLCGRASGYSGTYFAITSQGASAHGKTIVGYGDCATNYINGGNPSQIQGTSLSCWNNVDRWNRSANNTGAGNFPVVRCTNLE